MSKVDLTKILKVGDKVWETQRGAGEVVEVGRCYDNDYPIVVSFCAGDNTGSFTTEGKQYISVAHPTLYPIDQKPLLPVWPLPEGVIEYKGKAYEKGEWVAVRDEGENWSIRKLDFIDPVNEPYLVIDNYGTGWRKMKKLKSFIKKSKK